jgi:8-oxo-dGTP pyrophosphatase MutT (NUDIX family)
MAGTTKGDPIDDFELLAFGPFDETATTCRWSDAAVPFSTRQIEEIDRRWNQSLRAAQADGRDLFAGSMARLTFWRVEERSLLLEFGPTDYREFVGTNLNPERRADDPRADPLGVSIAILTTDRKLILQRRSQTVFEHPGFFHVCGGNVEPVDVPQGGPFATARRELAEEFSLPAAAIPTIAGFAIGVNRRNRKPEFLTCAEVDASSARLLETESREHQAVVAVERTAEALSAFLLKHWQETTPAGRMCLLAFGRHAFGKKWFSQTSALLRDQSSQTGLPNANT